MFLVLLAEMATSLPTIYVGASAMFHVEPFLSGNVVVWPILLPLTLL